MKKKQRAKFYATLENGLEFWKWIPEYGVFFKVISWKDDVIIDPVVHWDSYDWVRKYTVSSHTDLDTLIGIVAMELL